MNDEEKAFDDIQKACRVLGWSICIPDAVDEDAEVEVMIIGKVERINAILNEDED